MEQENKKDRKKFRDWYKDNIANNPNVDKATKNLDAIETEYLLYDGIARDKKIRALRKRKNLWIGLT